jgi:hypothetical protein
MSDPRTHEVHGDEGMPAEFIDRPDVVPGDGHIPDEVTTRNDRADDREQDQRGDDSC